MATHAWLSNGQKNALLGLLLVLVIVLTGILFWSNAKEKQVRQNQAWVQSTVKSFVNAPTTYEASRVLERAKNEIVSTSKQSLLKPLTSKADWLDCAQAMAEWQWNAVQHRASCTPPAGTIGEESAPVDYFCGFLEQVLGEDLGTVLESCGFSM